MTAWHGIVVANVVAWVAQWGRKVIPTVVDRLHIDAHWVRDGDGATFTWTGRNGTPGGSSLPTDPTVTS